MRELYVIDTCALISFFHVVFVHAKGYEGSPQLSRRVSSLIGEAVFSGWTRVRLSIPSVVFVEIYAKWLCSEEFCRMFFCEVYDPLRSSDNVEIRPTDREVLEYLLQIGGSLADHDLHDRLVLASAMALAAPLITTDAAVADYVNETHVLPCVLN
jgi:hypothetical protein